MNLLSVLPMLLAIMADNNATENHDDNRIDDDFDNIEIKQQTGI